MFTDVGHLPLSEAEYWPSGRKKKAAVTKGLAGWGAAIRRRVDRERGIDERPAKKGRKNRDKNAGRQHIHVIVQTHALWGPASGTTSQCM